jgi:hypothetical protein
MLNNLKDTSEYLYIYMLLCEGLFLIQLVQIRNLRWNLLKVLTILTGR